MSRIIWNECQIIRSGSRKGQSMYGILYFNNASHSSQYRISNNMSILLYIIYQLLESYLQWHSHHSLVDYFGQDPSVRHTVTCLKMASKSDKDVVLDLLKYSDQRVRVKFQVLMRTDPNKLLHLLHHLCINLQIIPVVGLTDWLWISMLIRVDAKLTES